MLFQIIEENGVKRIQALTADTGAGAPVGSFVYMYKKSSPSGYLFCDGSTFDETKYPALYQYLGSNVLPDYRECVAVGAEQNTTDTIASHDVYTEGQFKDDQMQMLKLKALGEVNSTGSFVTLPTVGNSVGNVLNITTDRTSSRIGDTTHGKQKAVFIYIKATSGLTENQQENVLNTINENLSYSTTEHKTGKKWIDGKDIYEKVIDLGNLPNATVKQVNTNITNLAKVVSLQGVANIANTDYFFPLPLPSKTNINEVVNIYHYNSQIVIESGVDRSTWTGVVTLEYTKTTDN